MIIEFDCFLIDEIGAVGDARFHDRCNHELFERRGDRAMIVISHDASYIREHCNRWALLHDGKLSPFDDFDLAYSAYKELIGADSRAAPVAVDFTGRARMVDSSQHSALSDERFRALVQQGDWARDRRDWQEAAAEYRHALQLYPYQRSYWTQLGHAEKEQGDFVQAEIAYRTAVALGEPGADVEEHARFVMSRQGDGGLSPPPLRAPRDGKTACQPPAGPDIELLWWLFGPGGKVGANRCLSLLRDHATLDELAAAIVRQYGISPGREYEDADALFDQARCLLSLPQSNIAGDHAGLLRDISTANALADWPLTQAALASLPVAAG